MLPKSNTFARSDTSVVIDSEPHLSRMSCERAGHSMLMQEILEDSGHCRSNIALRPDNTFVVHVPLMG